MQLIDVIHRSAAYLAGRGVTSPRLQVELILAQALKLPRLQLYLEFERELDATVLDGVREAVRRRGSREPLQHILGTTSFCGLEMEVSREVLIPRPETELLAERAWTWLRQRTASDPGPLTALDWGTGSGCLAVTLAMQVPEALVTALDISPSALEVARRNAERHGVLGRIGLVCTDGVQSLPAEAGFDLVVSNPPYIPTSELESLEPEVRDHDPRVALDGGADGLQWYRRLADELRCRLRHDGVLMVEFGDGQAPAVSRLMAEKGWVVLEIHRDYSGRERFLATRWAG